MNKLRTTSWFLILVVLLATLVTLTMAQETPAAIGGQIFHQDSFESLSDEPLAQSSEETQIELSAAGRQSHLIPTASMSLAPAAAGEPPEPVAPPDTPVAKYPGDLSQFRSPKYASPVELELTTATGQQPDFSGRFVGVPQPDPSPSAVGETCQQLLQNTKLTVSSTGSIAPWTILEQIVYFHDTIYASPPHSLLVEDNDSGDSSPTLDGFAQSFSTPSNLTKVTIKYATASLDSNNADKVWGNVYTVDAGGNLDQLLVGWEVGQSPDTWQTQTVTITDKTILQSLAGKDLAIVLFNNTTGSAPGEVVFFDDVTLTACVEDAPNSFIIVRKKSDPAGATQKFTFNPSWSASNFQLKHNESKKSPALAPGSYSVKELAQSGWQLTGATCSDGSSPNNISLQEGETVTCTFKNLKQSASQTCKQMLVNYKLDINEFDDSSGTAEPWVIVHPIVWYTKNPNTAYDGFSLFLADGDVGNDGKVDPSPKIDMFAQGFQMPGNLTEIKVEFRRATLNSNSADKVYGELWKLDNDWVLHLDQPGKYYVAGWDVAESEGAWAKQIVTSTDSKILSAMAGQKTAILLFNITDNGGKKEKVYFDNVMLSACSKGAPGSNKIFLPVTMKKYGKAAGPICNPPSENPADNFTSNRGLVQTGAICSSKMSSFDTADYYTFKPAKNGNHTLHLTNLPPGTQWAAMIFINQANPDYAPGNAPDGRCRITQPGHGNKTVICNLNTGKNYVVKVSSGSTPVSGNYRMKITPP